MKPRLLAACILRLKLPAVVSGLLAFQLTAGAAVLIEDSKTPGATGLGVRIFEDTDIPNAVLISFVGKCSYSEDGAVFTEIGAKHVFTVGSGKAGAKPAGATKAPFVFTQGMVVRTGADSRVDLFFRRIGTTVRLQPETEIRLETMARRMEGGVPVMQTLLDLRKGRIFTVSRSLVPKSTFEIRNAAGRSVVEGCGGKCRYIVTADGSHVTEKNSVAPVKVVGENGVTLITPGMKLAAKDGKMLPLEAPESVKLLIEFDELDSLEEQWSVAEKPAGE